MAAYEFATTRLFVPDPLPGNAGAVSVVGDRANYLLNVLRLRDGDGVLVFNGADGEWRAALAQSSKRATTLVIEEQVRPQTHGVDLDYCFAPLKHARLDYTVQKATEMGVRRLRPVLTRRTQVSRINLDRMRANVVEAAEQCGILNVPAVEDERSFDKMLGGWEPGRILVVCDEDAPIADPLAALRQVRSPEKLAMLIGPEGGFAPEERAAFNAHPAVVRISLGPRILRADTAAVAGLTLLQAVLGDWPHASA